MAWASARCKPRSRRIASHRDAPRRSAAQRYASHRDEVPFNGGQTNLLQKPNGP